MTHPIVAEPLTPSVTLYEGDALAVLPTLAAGSVDAVVTDPPYPEIDRDYGRLSESQWWDLMMGVCGEVRRVLKPTGSAMFILQPNSRNVGSMRGWLWKFMAWACDEWNMVQDVWWWNHTTPPTVHCQEKYGLMRPSLKACVWLGLGNCYRDQSVVLLPESIANAKTRKMADNSLCRFPSGMSIRRLRTASRCVERDGVTPFNLLPIANSNSTDSAGSHNHGAGTPSVLAEWWVRYITPPDGIVLDMFAGSGTTALACLREHKRCILVEREPEYCAIIRKRVSEFEDRTPLFRDEPVPLPVSTPTQRPLFPQDSP
ncbi:MAG: site-specific DNA-methyltransferase [Phycisphaerales bacterium]